VPGVRRADGKGGAIAALPTISFVIAAIGNAHFESPYGLILQLTEFDVVGVTDAQYQSPVAICTALSGRPGLHPAVLHLPSEETYLMVWYLSKGDRLRPTVALKQEASHNGSGKTLRNNVDGLGGAR
jgi:hypothetical protein